MHVVFKKLEQLPKNHYGGVTMRDARDCAEGAKSPRFHPEMRITEASGALGSNLVPLGSVP